jgi:spermidine synthase
MKQKSVFLSLAFLLATCSLVYELAFAKVISELTGNAMVWESVSMASFLLGIGVQSFFGRRSEYSWARLARNELLLSALVVIGWYGVHYLQMNYRAYVFDLGQMREIWPIPPVYLLGVLSQPVILLIGWLSGYELSFFLGYRLPSDLRFREAKILSAYHFGALAGTLVVLLSMRQAVAPLPLIAGASVVNAVIAGVLFVTAGERIRLIHTAVTLLFLGWAAAFQGIFEQVFLQHHYYNQFRWQSDESGLRDVKFPADPFAFILNASTWPEVVRFRSPFQVIDFVPDVEDSADELGEGTPVAMFINGRFQISRKSAAEYHEYMTHGALAYAAGPVRRVVILGGGDGALALELLKYPDLQVDMIELDPVILHLARTYEPLTTLNRHALDHPRLRVLQQDALRYMRTTDAVYDAVFIDLTYPFEFDSAKFYSAEFLHLVRRRLSADGILVAGIPMNLVSDSRPELVDLVIGTMAKAEFTQAMAWNFSSHHFVAASRGSLLSEPRELPALDFQIFSPSRLTQLERRQMSLQEAPEPYFSLQYPNALMSNDPFF